MKDYKTKGPLYIQYNKLIKNINEPPSCDKSSTSHPSISNIIAIILSGISTSKITNKLHFPIDLSVKIIMMTWFLDDTVSFTSLGWVDTVSKPSKN